MGSKGTTGKGKADTNTLIAEMMLRKKKKTKKKQK